jgi:hypothetical protein
MEKLGVANSIAVFKIMFGYIAAKRLIIQVVILVPKRA